MADFRYDGQRLAYTIHGQGPRTTVLLPALLLSQKSSPRRPGLTAGGVLKNGRPRDQNSPR